MILLRRVSKYVYDVFTGTQWPQADHVPGATGSEWTRVKKHHWGVTHEAGEPINRVKAKQLLALIEAHPQGSIDPIPV